MIRHHDAAEETKVGMTIRSRHDESIAIHTTTMMDCLDAKTTFATMRAKMIKRDDHHQKSITMMTAMMRLHHVAVVIEIGTEMIVATARTTTEESHEMTTTIGATVQTDATGVETAIETEIGNETETVTDATNPETGAEIMTEIDATKTEIEIEIETEIAEANPSALPRAALIWAR